MSSNDEYLIVSDSYSNLFMLNYEKSYMKARSLKGSTGSVLDFEQAGTKIVFSGLDRIVRVVDYTNYEQLAEIYVKTRVNALLIKEVEAEEEQDEEDDCEDEEADDFEDEEDDDFEDEEEDDE